MIFLKSIYSEPEGLFERVDFHDGINVIYGRYSEKGQKKDSLNSIGKSTLVQLINFCLLSSYDKRNKLSKASKLMEPYYIVLELEINGVPHLIKRSTRQPNQILFGKIGEKIDKFSLSQLKKILTNMFFCISDYSGVFSHKWFRKLIPLFIRDEKNGFGKDPILFIENVSYLQMVPYNLFLLGIDNSFAMKNCELRTELKRRQQLQTEIKQIIFDTYGIRDIQDSNVIIQNLTDEVSDLELAISNFELSNSYAETENLLNEITKRIKNLVLENHTFIKRLEGYKASIEMNVNLSTDKIERLYKEIDEHLGIQVKKKLDEAIEFKQKLINSRKIFLNSEINQLSEAIENNKQLIEELDEKRSRLFKFLEEKEAIKDLTSAFNELNEKKEMENELKGKLKIYNDIQSEILQIKQNEAGLEVEINDFVKSIESNVKDIRKVFNEIYSALFKSEDGLFNIAYVDGKQDAKIGIKATTFDSSGWGKGRANILIYDLTVLINAIRRNFTFPRFLIHDGIFNGVHKSQFIATMNYLHSLSQNTRFQYIFTANESDIWIKEDKENLYGKLDIDLEKNIIAEYNESNKIFGTDF